MDVPSCSATVADPPLTSQTELRKAQQERDRKHNIPAGYYQTTKTDVRGVAIEGNRFKSGVDFEVAVPACVIAEPGVVVSVPTLDAVFDRDNKFIQVPRADGYPRKQINPLAWLKVPGSDGKTSYKGVEVVRCLVLGLFPDAKCTGKMPGEYNISISANNKIADIKDLLSRLPKGRTVGWHAFEAGTSSPTCWWL